MGVETRTIIYHGIDGSTWHLHGPDMGAEGVYLASLAGFYFPLRVPLSQKPAYMRGAKPGPSKTDPSKIGLKVTTTAESQEDWEPVESAWWRAWSDEEDGTLEVISHTGETRKQPVRVETWPTEPFDWEPVDVMDWTLPIIAYSPGWRGELIELVWENTGGAAEATGTFAFSNPGDIEVWPQFAGWGHDGEAVTLPDGLSDNTVRLPADGGLADGEHWLVDTDQTQMTAESVTNTQIAARMAGLKFQHPIPARTLTPVNVDVSVTGGSAATEVKAYIQPLYQRPWG